MAKWIDGWRESKLVDDEGEILASVFRPYATDTEWQFGSRRFIDKTSAQRAAEIDREIIKAALGGGGRW